LVDRGGGKASTELEIQIRSGSVVLPGTLAVPMAATGAVVFAHGSGSSRLSPRNRGVAGRLLQAGLATLLFDLLTPDEADDRANVFDIELLAGRLQAATGWLRDGSPLDASVPVGYFGASTGAAGALWAAAEIPDQVRAVVSRGGRPDLAGARLSAVSAPTLLIVGDRDEQVLELNRQAMTSMAAEVELVIVEGATHLFEEPGTLERVAEHATAWFLRSFSQGHDDGRDDQPGV
jgi:putative phosphoribosyl transferase